MLAVDERKERMNELRKAHFHLGFDNANKISEYKEYYTEKDLAHRQPQSAEALRFEEYRKNPRQTHYQLSNDDDKGLYMSIAKQSYKDVPSQEKAQLSENTKNDLRSHHFVLGYHSVDDPTEYKREFLKKDGKGNEVDKAETQNFLRKHNHDFGDRNKYYNTTYDVQHNQQYDPEFLKQTLGKDQLRQKTLEIRKTNIKIGNAQPDYITHNGTVHTSQQHNQRIANSQNNRMESFLKGSHMVLGTENPTMSSVNKTTYTGQQPIDRTILDKDQLRDFRATHFNLALQKEQLPETTHKSHFVATGANALEVRKPFLQASHFYIDQGLTRKDYLDTYNSAYKQGIGGGVPIAVPERRSDVRKSQVVLGSDPVNEDHFKSEARKNYVEYKGAERASLNEETKKNLRAHHYELGEDNEQWKTHNSEYNGQGPRTTLDEKTMHGLRGHHFKYGNAKGEYWLHSWEIGSKQGPPNILNQEKQQDLRKHHFKEEGEGNYRTSYQIQTSQH